MTLTGCLTLMAGPAAADCGPWPAGVAVRTAAGKPLSFSVDFDRDGSADRLELVSLAAGTQLPPDIRVTDPWDKRPASLGRTGMPVALGISQGSRPGDSCRRFLLVNRDFFATPLWTAYLAGQTGTEPPALSILTQGSPKHRQWQRKFRALAGDAAELATEAGIDILLYWQGKEYRIYWPPEEP
jgi:hypothetical protein